MEPALATLRARAPQGSGWIFEIKFDGYRAQAHLAGGRVRIYTRRGYDWSDRFATLIEALREIDATSAVIDGEVVVLDADGVSDYPKLQQDLAQRRSDRLVYYAFDLLYLDGFDLRDVPLVERKRLLARVLGNSAHPQVRFSDHIEADGASVVERACEMRLEGIVCKRADAPYRSGRQDTWLKLKCHKRDDFPIIAFVEKLGAKPRRIASLYLGREHGERLLYAGKAQAGFTEPIMRELRERLDPYIRKTSPLSVPIKKPKATWVEPALRAEVQYSSVTSDGVLREAVFKGVRDDLAPATSHRERRKRSGKPVPKENILQLLPDAHVPSAEELNAYWTAVCTRALPYLARRPLKLVRSVSGTTFYHMGRLPPRAPGVHELKIVKRDGGEGRRVWIEDLAGLLGLVEMDAVELHPWNATIDDIEHADTLVFDLDPSPAIPWQFVIDTALVLRDLLVKEGHESWPKLTGGKGLHLMIPIERRMTHDAAHRYCKRIAQRLAATDRTRYTIQANLPARRGRLFIDYLRNGRGTTAVGAYSPRARAGFPIAAPTTWKEVEQGIAPDAWHLEDW